MVKLFKIKEIFYFESSLEIRKITEEEIEKKFGIFMLGYII